MAQSRMRKCTVPESHRPRHFRVRPLVPHPLRGPREGPSLFCGCGLGSWGPGTTWTRRDQEDDEGMLCLFCDPLRRRSSSPHLPHLGCILLCMPHRDPAAEASWKPLLLNRMGSSLDLRGIGAFWKPCLGLTPTPALRPLFRGILRASPGALLRRVSAPGPLQNQRCSGASPAPSGWNLFMRHCLQAAPDPLLPGDIFRGLI
ncbi:hypothetical protein NDU88_006504 [Pleurodeles waltl]|uniref:Uncharacterized protein n=1 Tax=Pleurodeles waltl TaxID=8319 RepID=A0AAV7QI72_PLEWA|nr:hypothetical protein NDU88_006504 [Pleurodeles waltl]